MYLRDLENEWHGSCRRKREFVIEIITDNKEILYDMDMTYHLYIPDLSGLEKWHGTEGLDMCSGIME